MKLLVTLRSWIFLGAMMMLAVSLIVWRQVSSVESSYEHGSIILLIPDSADATTPEVRIWTDAASERGVLLRPMRISDWMRGANYGDALVYPSVIVPDTFHRTMSDAAVKAVYRLVEAGGNALIVQDGGILNERGSYTSGPSRFSAMVGVQYGDYDRYREQLSHYDEIHGAPTVLEDLGIPPGRYLEADAASKLTTIDNKDLQSLGGQFSALIAGYTAETQRFAVLKTDRPQLKQVLLKSTSGDIVSNINTYGRGKALFVNLPLTYLVERTDGIFLHGMLKYFAKEVVGQPQLMSTPNGKGVLILNWHNDDGRAIGFLETLQSAGIFDHGHQSMHFTAGPDVNVEGDKLGMDLNNNPAAQAMIQKLRNQGHSIGNHGGWIHNHFGYKVTDDNMDDFIDFLDLNNDAVTRANAGIAPREYSAPIGSQPLWSYDWLKKNGVIAYYTVSNVGMAPTRLWMGRRRISDAWAFPVMTYGQIASAEEASFKKMPLAEFDEWLQKLARFIEQQRVMRLSYFHPVGAVLYLPAVNHYIDAFQACVDRNRCKFMSMSESADFLTLRGQTTWSLQTHNKSEILSASHPNSLANLSWTIPRNHYTQVRVQSGNATVETTPTAWYVHAAEGKSLTLELQPRS